MLRSATVLLLLCGMSGFAGQSAVDRVATLKQVAALISQQHWQDAQISLRPLLSGSSPDPLALNLAGFIEMSQGHGDAAEVFFQRAIASGPRLAGPHVNLAVLYSESDPDRALRELQQALALDGHNQQALDLVRKVSKSCELNALHSGNTDQALSCADQARRLAPGDPETQYAFGMVALETGMYADAQIALLQALKLKPSDGEAKYALARVYLKENRAQDAESEMRQYVDEHPQDASAQYGLGYILVAEQKLDAAQAAFERSLDLQPSQTESLFQLGEIALQKGQVETARKRYSEALLTDSHHAGALTGLAVMAFRTGNYTEAGQDLKSAISASPSYAKAHYYYGLLLSKTGDKQGAAREFEAATRLQEQPLTKATLVTH